MKTYFAEDNLDVGLEFGSQISKESLSELGSGISKESWWSKYAKCYQAMVGIYYGVSKREEGYEMFSS